MGPRRQRRRPRPGVRQGQQARATAPDGPVAVDGDRQYVGIAEEPGDGRVGRRAQHREGRVELAEPAIDEHSHLVGEPQGVVDPVRHADHAQGAVVSEDLG